MGAIEDLTVAINLFSAISVTHARRADVQLNEGKASAAELARKREADEQIGLARFDRSLAHAVTGDNEASMRDLSEALRLNPGLATHALKHPLQK